jgi:hypothetical protein
MMRPMLAAAALLALGTLPVAAQDLGGVRLRGPEAVLQRVEQASASGCRLSATSVTVGVNRATAPGSRASQQLGTDGSGGCRPLVSTQVTAGVNLALGRGSQADQSIVARAPSGLLATTTVARGVNLAAGARSTATQGILGRTGR